MVNPEPYYEIRSSDVGKPHIRAFGRVWPVSGFIGHIMSKDVGKRVYERGGIVQVENDDQRAFRLHGLRRPPLWAPGWEEEYDAEVRAAADHVASCPGCGKAINPIPAPGTYSCSGCGATVSVNPLPSNFADVTVHIQYLASTDLPKVRAWARRNKVTLRLEQYARGAYSGTAVVHAPWNVGKDETDRTASELRLMLQDLHSSPYWIATR